MIEKKIQVITIATGPYWQYVDKFINSVSEVYRKKNLNFRINILTDQTVKPDEIQPNCIFVKIKHKKWPLPTLERYSSFLLLEDLINEHDFIVYSDVDMRFLDVIDFQITQYLFGVEHPGYFKKKKKPFINNKNSNIYIKLNDRANYICGGIQGGVAKYFFEASRTLSKIIERDISIKHIPKWHDESYWNYYYHSNKDKFVILGPEYCWPEEWAKEPFNGKVLALTKSKDITRVKSLTNFILTLFGRAKRILRKSTY